MGGPISIALDGGRMEGHHPKGLHGGGFHLPVSPHITGAAPSYWRWGRTLVVPPLVVVVAAVAGSAKACEAP